MLKKKGAQSEKKQGQCGPNGPSQYQTLENMNSIHFLHAKINIYIGPTIFSNIIISEKQQKSMKISGSLTNRSGDLCESEFCPSQGKASKAQDQRNTSNTQKLHMEQSVKSEKWSLYENSKYRQFCKDNQKLLQESHQVKKAKKVNVLMSRWIETRTSSQCRSHHQKMLKRHKTIAAIVRHYEKIEAKFHIQSKPTIQQPASSILQQFENPVETSMTFPQPPFTIPTISDALLLPTPELQDILEIHLLPPTIWQEMLRISEESDSLFDLN